MNTPWIVGAVAALIYFAAFEVYAFKHPERQNTLSRSVYNLGKSWPLSIFLLGLLIGALATHFYWSWCPDLGSTNG